MAIVIMAICDADGHMNFTMGTCPFTDHDHEATPQDAFTYMITVIVQWSLYVIIGL